MNLQASSEKPSDLSSSDLLPACRDDFVRAYVSVATEINTIASYVKLSEKPPNVPEAQVACEDLQKNFPGISCSVAALQANPKTDDFATLCKSVAELYQEQTGIDPSLPKPVAILTDASPLNGLKPLSLNVMLKVPSELQKLVDHPRLSFAIAGKIQSLSEALESLSQVRCAIDTESTSPLSMKASTQRISRIEENYQSGYRVTRLVVENARFEIICLSQTGAGLTLGGLRRAFGQLADFSPAK